MANREIEAILRLSAKLGNVQALKTLQRELKKVDDQAKAFNASQSTMVRAQQHAWAAMSRFVAPAALGYGMKQAFVDFAEMERRMNRIGITAGSSAAETKQAFEDIQRSAKQFALPIDEAVKGLDTLVSSGLTLKEAMAFLPSVLATAQAAGASTEDIANTALKAAGALKIEAREMQRAFDVMVAGGKEGQFELKDMAAYIPELANSFASLGYEGQEGLKTLVALLQTIREDTGSASAAATQAQNIFGKMFSGETAKKFSEFGIDLRKEMKAAKAAGEDAVAAFVRLSKEAVDGDLSKLPLLFTDQEFRLGMQSLMTSADSYRKFVAAVNSSQVDGSVLRDLGRILQDNQAKIDRMAASWDRLKLAAGGKAAPVIGGAMDILSEEVEKGEFLEAALKKRGLNDFQRSVERLRLNFSPTERNLMIFGEGWRSEAGKQISAMPMSKSPEMAANALRSPDRLLGPRREGTPVPTPRPDPNASRGYRTPASSEVFIPALRPFAAGASPRDAERYSMDRLPRQAGDIADMRGGRSSAPAGFWKSDAAKFLFGDLADGKSVKEAMKIDLDGTKAASAVEDAGGNLASIIQQAFERGAASIRSSISEALASGVRVNLSGPASAVSGVRGRTMPDAGTTPARP